MKLFFLNSNNLFLLCILINYFFSDYFVFDIVFDVFVLVISSGYWSLCRYSGKGNQKWKIKPPLDYDTRLYHYL